MIKFFLKLYVIFNKGYAWYKEHEEELKPLIDFGKDAVDKYLKK